MGSRKNVNSNSTGSIKYDIKNRERVYAWKVKKNCLAVTVCKVKIKYILILYLKVKINVNICI